MFAELADSVVSGTAPPVIEVPGNVFVINTVAIPEGSEEKSNEPVLAELGIKEVDEEPGARVGAERPAEESIFGVKDTMSCAEVVGEVVGKDCGELVAGSCELLGVGGGGVLTGVK